MSRKELDKMILTIPKTLSQEEYRIACCVATGHFNEKSLNECIKFYSLNKETAKFWWDNFGLDGPESFSKVSRKRKSSDFKQFLVNNVNRNISIKEICEELNISMPTAYKYVSENRSFFKKAGRGCYTIIDAEKERLLSKK